MKNFGAEKYRLAPWPNWPAARAPWPSAGKFIHVEPKVTLMKPYQDRVVAELADLQDKTNKLINFIGHPEAFEALPVEDQVLLRLQAEYMRLYLSILRDRVARFKEDPR